jgi:aquaporin Z
MGITITGTSVNHARSIAPAIIQAISGKTEAIKQIWIFIVGPLCGGALAAFAYEAFYGFAKDEKTNKEE